jgi:hypothetical protein
MVDGKPFRIPAICEGLWGLRFLAESCDEGLYLHKLRMKKVKPKLTKEEQSKFQYDVEYFGKMIGYLIDNLDYIERIYDIEERELRPNTIDGKVPWIKDDEKLK